MVEEYFYKESAEFGDYFDILVPSSETMTQRVGL